MNNSPSFQRVSALYLTITLTTPYHVVFYSVQTDYLIYAIPLLDLHLFTFPTAPHKTPSWSTRHVTTWHGMASDATLSNHIPLHDATLHHTALHHTALPCSKWWTALRTVLWLTFPCSSATPTCLSSHSHRVSLDPSPRPASPLGV